MARRISFELAIPHICVPTTHTGAAGDLPTMRKRNKDRSGSKKPQGDGDVQKHDESTGSPGVIIYDKEFTESRVKRFSAPSGMMQIQTHLRGGL
ncbi:hypothetical protein Trco_002402 [Trichoderma cornu-damae]|uniref:Uncharacterized protein n=1 Tax=Trichoderma cornu-damae TaxID=654480 RepID=A0A9P8QMK1_9HYPO|nr:hypothetical protein Trco_002402 [Trichoderma cornu-damae]